MTFAEFTGFNYVETFKDCIRMALILHIHLQEINLYYHPHDCALFGDILKSANITAILIQSLNVSM